MYVTKFRTTITISPELLEKTRKHDININYFLDIKLRRYIVLVESSGPKWF